MEQSIKSILESKINTLKNQKADIEKQLQFLNEQLFILEDAIKKNESNLNFEKFLSNMEKYVYYNNKWMTHSEFMSLQPINPKTLYAKLIKESFGDYMQKIPVKDLK